MSDVTPEMAVAFMQSEGKAGLSGRTWNGVLALLKSAFRKLGHKGNVVLNPFDGIPTKEMDTVHRKPFTQEELKAILNAAQGDDFMRPIFVTGICTAMRRGDCCMLRWADVDLKANFVRVKTSKTGETVEIPMFPLLREELARRCGNGSDFVFPEQAQMYQENDDGITYRVRQVFEAAGFYDEEDEDEDDEEATPDRESDARPLLPAAQLLDRGLQGLAAVPEGAIDAEKRARMIEAFRLYVGGLTLPAVAQKMGASKSSVSGYLREVDERTGLRVKRARGEKKDRPKCLGGVTAERGEGKRRASVRDFHSFRVTWITLALAAGVPMELVTRVTGHQTVDVVLKHYFRPGREDFRRAIESAMPKLLMEGGATYEVDKGPGELLEDALKGLQGLPAPAGKTGKAWTQEKARIVALVRQAKEWIDGRVVREKVGAAGGKTKHDTEGN
jgi:integrase